MSPRRMLLLGWFCASALFAGSVHAASDDRWLRVQAPEFTLITQLSDKQAVAWAAEFSQFIGALKAFFPIDVRELPALTVVIFARDRSFNAYRPLGSDKRPQEVIGFFTRRETWAVAGMGASDFNRIRTTIFHEGTHWFMSGFKGHNPVWLEEGIAELFSTFAVDGKKFSWGKAIGPHIAALNALGPMPMERFLFLSKADLFAGDSEGMERTGIAYAQSWAFMHYLIFGEEAAKTRPAFLDYLRAFGAGGNPDNAFTQAFGITYQQMDAKLRDYLRNGRYFTMSSALVPVTGLAAEPATPLQVEGALARLSLAGRRYEEALAHAQKAHVAGGESAETHVLLGEVYSESQQPAKAQEAFEQAVAKGSKHFRPHFEIAAARHRAGTSAGSSLSAEEARNIANGYQRAINAHPKFLPAFQGLAGVIETVPPGNPEDARFLEFGLRLFPDDAIIRVGLAVQANRDGRHEEAKKYLGEVLNAPKPPPARIRSYAQRLEASWQVRDLAARVAELEKAGKYPEAIALAKSAAAESGDMVARQRYQSMLRNLENAERNHAVRLAWEAGNWGEARRLIQDVLASDTASPVLKTQMGNRLKELDRKGLGKQ